MLVERSARGVRLTEAGEAVVRHADAILAKLARGRGGARGDRRAARRAPAAWPPSSRPRRRSCPWPSPRFAEEHPGVELSLSLLEPEDAVAALKAGDIDLAFTFGSGKPEDRGGDGVTHHHLLEDPMYLVLAEDHPLARKRGMRLADLAGEPWIGGAPDCECNRLISAACNRSGFEPRIAFETDDYAAVQGFVAAGVGVSLIAELGLRTIRDDIVVRPLGRDTPCRQIFATALDGYRSPATVAMIEMLREVGQGMPPAARCWSSSPSGRGGGDGRAGSSGRLRRPRAGAARRARRGPGRA